MSVNGITAFGVRTAETEADVADAIALLYNKAAEYNSKEQKKIDKWAKLKAKNNKAAAAKTAPKKDRKKKEAPKKVNTDAPYIAPAKGEKKDVTRPLPASYNPIEVEDSWYSWWVSQGYFKPEYNEERSKKLDQTNFTIVIPPPNVTGTLHLGHALTNAIEDSVVRWHRMLGRSVLWNPGCDHAGIATQSVVEKKLMRETGQNRLDLGREEFLKKVWEWKDEKGGVIYDQLRGLGASLDWDREAFTMSPKCVKAVEAAFIQMHEGGLIKRSDRLINWSCQLQSAISDIEVDHVDIPGRTLISVPGYDEGVEVGVMISFAYKLKDSDSEIVVATTRIETMLGDVAVAVSPGDPRYAALVGKKLVHPFIADREITIIEDDMVDRSLGTAAVKITPSHDPKDYECGKRHNLPFITMLSKDGKISENMGEFSGMLRYDARKAIVAKLQEMGLYRGVAENPMVLKVCSRSKDIIEPMKIPQWFCETKEMAADAVRAVKEGELKLIPERHVSTWNHFLGDGRDWCISRQLWWGHRIPAYFVSVEGQKPGNDADNKYWVSAPTEAEALAKAAERFGVDASKISLRQDDDVLDTWFSSGIYPISIFGWPDQTEDMEKYFPGHLLETGHDILFFWVARMVMMCKYLTGKLPFTEVFLHSMVRDAHGRKMSKSTGNVIDPMDVRNGVTLKRLNESLLGGNLSDKEVKKAQAGQKADFPDGIPECGVDALRFGLCAFLSRSGGDINLDVNRVIGYRQFCNKIWNAIKFVLMALGPEYTASASATLSGKESAADRWILSRLADAVGTANVGMKTYDFQSVTQAIHSFIQYDFCSTYMEWVKPVVFADGGSDAKTCSRAVLYTCTDALLKLMHPFMPFLTEELWQRLPRRAGDTTPSICVANYPTDVSTRDEQLEADTAVVNGVVDLCRSMKASYSIKSSEKGVKVYLKPGASASGVANMLGEIQTLARVDATILAASDAAPAGCGVALYDGTEIHMMIKGLVDIPTELAKLKKELERLEKAISKDTAFLGSEGANKMKAKARADREEKHKLNQEKVVTINEAVTMFTNL